MQLHQVQAFGIQVLQAALDEGSQILAVVAGSIMRVQPAPGLGDDVKLIRPVLLRIRAIKRSLRPSP